MMTISENVVVVVADDTPAPDCLQPRLPRPPGSNTFPHQLTAWQISQPAGGNLPAVNS